MQGVRSRRPFGVVDGPSPTLNIPIMIMSNWCLPGAYKQLIQLQPSSTKCRAVLEV